MSVPFSRPCEYGSLISQGQENGTDTNQGSHRHIFRRGIDNDGGYNVCECGFRKYDTNQASELFELCKEVYKRTGWDDLADDHPWITERGVLGYKRNGVSPLYTSDYLLEKLPGWTELRKKTTNYYIAKRDALVSFSFECDTPLKALLKLTIALSEAGELK